MKSMNSMQERERKGGERNKKKAAKREMEGKRY